LHLILALEANNETVDLVPEFSKFAHEKAGVLDVVRHFDDSLELLAFEIVEFAQYFVLLNVKSHIVGGVRVLNFDVLEMIGDGLGHRVDGAVAVGQELDDVDDR